VELRDSTALISGGASGLGATTAGEFIKRGARVVLLDLDERGEGAASSLGDRARFVAGDVTSETTSDAPSPRRKNSVDGSTLPCAAPGSGAADVPCGATDRCRWMSSPGS
jgi:NAD(P)-dependent dehydrogenase (short-subunit alcohol dehydrogenase family)